MRNQSNYSTARLPPNFEPIFHAQLASSVFFMIASPITIVSNVLVLLTIYKDPLRCFRTPTTYFIVFLALMDLVTGALVMPATIIFLLACYLKQTLEPGKVYIHLAKVGNALSYAGMNSSFLFVLALTWTQYVAITFPHKYRALVTPRRVVACSCSFTLYFTVWTVIEYTQVLKNTFYKIDLHLHSTVISTLLLVGNILLYKSYRRFARASRRIGATSVNREVSDRGRRIGASERHFTVATLFLSILFLLHGLPHILFSHFWLYDPPTTAKEFIAMTIAFHIANDLMYLKVTLDAFIFAWRLPQYRQSLRRILRGISGCIASGNETGGDGSFTLQATSAFPQSTSLK